MLEIPSSAPMMAVMSSSLGALNASPLDILGTVGVDGYNLDDGSRKLEEQWWIITVDSLLLRSVDRLEQTLASE
jgi:hypothetical protein